FKHILGADLNGNGRIDLVIPYQGKNQYDRHFVSESLATGFRDYTYYINQFALATESAFQAVDFSGQGNHAVDPARGFVEMSTSALGTVAEHSKGTLSVVSCDINADGVYDIVFCKVETPGADITFKFTTFLGDGMGGFQQLGDAVKYSYSYSPALTAGTWSTSNLSGSQVAELVYTGLVQVGNMEFKRIATSLPSGQVQYSSTDLNANSIPFQSSQTKVYKWARNDSFVVNEVFEQDFPLTGLRTQIETSAIGGPVLKSETLSYSQTPQAMNTWNIFRTDRTSEQADTFDGTQISRSIGTQYTTMKKGTFWNDAISKFRMAKCQGFVTDFRVVTDASSFCTTSYACDQYGNQTSSVTASGLNIATTYDSTYQTFPIQWTEVSIAINFDYQVGGATIAEQKCQISVQDGASTQTPLASSTKALQRIAGEDRITSKTDENNLTTTYTYDNAGSLLKCQDPAGNVETRTERPDRNQCSWPDESFQVDAKGRTLKRVGSDGRSIVYSYDKNGFMSLSSVTIFPGSSSTIPESEFLFEYDSRGRVSKKTIVLAAGGTYSTEFRCRKHGRLLMTSTGTNGPWATSSKVLADISNYSPFGRAGLCRISGTGFAHDFTHAYTWDAQGFPLTHTMSGADILVQNDYTYNDNDQLQSSQELISGQETSYSYSGKRLASSTVGSEPVNAYTYDDSGNMTSRGWHIGVSGRLRCCGKNDSRTTPDHTLAFTYDGFGHMSTITDGSTKEEIQLLNDFSGHTIQRVKSDGSQEIFINKNYTIIVKPNGQRYARYALFNQQELLASATVELPAASLTSSVTPSVESSTGFGLLDLLLVDVALLLRPDGMNRHSFENNDPIITLTHQATSVGIPLGRRYFRSHDCRRSRLGVASFGGSAVLSSALISGGIAGMQYSISHANEQNSGKFWGHFGVTVGVNMLVGAATEGLGAAMRVSKLGEWACDAAKSSKLATALRVGGKALSGGISSVASSVGDKEADNLAFHEHKNIWAGAGADFAEGAGMGLLEGGGKELKGHLQAKYGDSAADSLRRNLWIDELVVVFLASMGAKGHGKGFKRH
ncbi:hypothetical protein ACKAV7_015154, partial [Fusarium commune]